MEKDDEKLYRAIYRDMVLQGIPISRINEPIYRPYVDADRKAYNEQLFGKKRNIDYKEEVNSGLDRKIYVEKTIEDYLKEGKDPRDIVRNPNFIPFKHDELLTKTVKNYHAKEEQILDQNGGYSNEPDEQVVPDDYFRYAHPLPEQYPDKEKSDKLFAERDQLRAELESIKDNNGDIEFEIEENNKRIEELVASMQDLIDNNPKLLSIIDFCEAYDEAERNGTELSYDIVSNMMNRYGITPRDNYEYKDVYEEYKKLDSELKKLKIKVDMDSTANKSNRAAEIKERIREIELELLLLNSKLVNFVIRTMFGQLLLEQEDVYQICLIGLLQAIRTHDHSKGSLSNWYVYPGFPPRYQAEVEQYFIQHYGMGLKKYYALRKCDIIHDTILTRYRYDMDYEDMLNAGLIDKETFKIVSEENVIIKPFAESDKDKDNNADYYYDDDEYDDFDKMEESEISPYDIEAEDYDIEEQVIKSTLKDVVADVLKTITPREEDILRKRYGLDDGHCMTLAEIANIYGLSRDRIRQIEVRALRKLRHPSRSKFLKDYVY